MAKKHKNPVAPLYRAASWSVANGDKPTERQPHLFYRAEDIDALVDKLERDRDLAMRRAAALEAFYLGEIKAEAIPLLSDKAPKRDRVPFFKPIESQS